MAANERLLFHIIDTDRVKIDQMLLVLIEIFWHAKSSGYIFSILTISTLSPVGLQQYYALAMDSAIHIYAY